MLFFPSRGIHAILLVRRCASSLWTFFPSLRAILASSITGLTPWVVGESSFFFFLFNRTQAFFFPSFPLSPLFFASLHAAHLMFPHSKPIMESRSIFPPIKQEQLPLPFPLGTFPPTSSAQRSNKPPSSSPSTQRIIAESVLSVQVFFSWAAFQRRQVLSPFSYRSRGSTGASLLERARDR